MFSDSIIVRDFLDNFSLLARIQDDINNDYDLMLSQLSIQKESKVRLIGNPILKFQSNLVELNYSLRIHVLNCNVYRSLIYDNVYVDNMLILQLRSLQETTYDIKQKYRSIKINIDLMREAKNMVV